jgi:hypothetical protein
MDDDQQGAGVGVPAGVTAGLNGDPLEDQRCGAAGFDVDVGVGRASGEDGSLRSPSPPYLEAVLVAETAL